MQFLKHKVPPPLVAIICAFLSWVMSIGSMPIVDAHLTRLACSLILLFVAGFIGVSGVVSFNKAKTTINPLTPTKASSLVYTGVFQYTRNPMYLCLALVILAFCTYLATPISIFGLAVFIVYITEFQIKPEEQALQSLFKDEYAAYCKQVRRWL